MKHFDRLADGEACQALVGVADLTRFAEIARTVPLAGLHGLVHEMAAVATEVLAPTSGQIVKYVGDAVFAAFPAEAADEGVRVFLDLRERLAARFAALGIGVTLTAHLGEVVVARLPPFGAVDLFGETVNAVFTMDRRTHRGRMVISDPVARRLEPATRARFSEHAAAVVYVAEARAR